jgi:hypothetical protein
MTREEAITAAPRRRDGYWRQFVFGAVFGVGLIVTRLVSLLMRKKYSSGGWGTDLVFTSLCLLIALPAAERLFYPIRAAKRTASLGPVAMKWLLRLEKFFLCLVIGSILVGLIAPISHVGFLSGSDLVILSYALFLLVSDVLGVEPARFTFIRAERSEQLHVTSLKPLQSERWGESRHFH